jgi:hypothetical protein
MENWYSIFNRGRAFIFATIGPQSALAPKEPHYLMCTESFFSGIKEPELELAKNLPPVPRSRMHGAVHPRPQ